MKNLLLVLLTLFSCAFVTLAASPSPNLIVYGPVPGLPPSDHYAVRVRPAGSDAPWQNTFVFKTACKDFGRNLTRSEPEGYKGSLSGWSHSYVNFETAGPVEVEIAKVDGTAIRKATVHPVRYGTNVMVKDGKAFFTLDKPCLVAVDINGEMRDQDTTRTPDGGWYASPPLHAISIFANPVLTNKPHLGDPSVYAVKPGEMPPTNGNWQTLYFLPGIHDIGLAFRLQGGKNYYLPGDAIVYGTFAAKNGNDIRLFGCGTLSGDHLTHPSYMNPPDTANYRRLLYYSIGFGSRYGTVVEGLTIANPAQAAVSLYSGTNFDAARPNIARWLKIIGWRGNADGFSVGRNSLVEDCFIRTQDDCYRPCGIGCRRLVLWNDVNGSAFLLSDLSIQKGEPLVVEDCDVIFARQAWYSGGNGGRIFNMRGEGKGACGPNVILRNIRVEDPRPTQQAFLIQMATEKPYAWPDSISRGPGDMYGVTFQNIQIAAPGIFGNPNVLYGGPECRIRDLTFDNVTIGGKKLTSINDFQTNKYVENIHFR